jgi:Glycosyltransferase 61
MCSLVERNERPLPSRSFAHSYSERPVFTPPYSKCEQLWDWPMLSAWQPSAPVVTGDRNTTTFTMQRSQAHPTARGSITTQVVRWANVAINRSPHIVIFVTHQDALVTNAWHRLAVQYMVWMAWQVAHFWDPAAIASHYDVDIALRCANVNEVLQGWSDLTFPSWDEEIEQIRPIVRCTNDWLPRSVDDLVVGFLPLLQQRDPAATIDAVIQPPNDGLLWDLAWDTTFNCSESHMFRTFMESWLHADPADTVGLAITATTSISATVCWMLRLGNAQRDIRNRDEVHAMLLSLFATVRLIHTTRYHSSAHIRRELSECTVIYGVHGAGLVPPMWATLPRPVALVEVLPRNQPQYFRSLSRLLGHTYEAVVAKEAMEEQYFTVDVEKSKQALQNVLDTLFSTA